MLHCVLARSAGLEPATYGLEGRCSIQLCYERFAPKHYTYNNTCVDMCQLKNKFFGK